MKPPQQLPLWPTSASSRSPWNKSTILKDHSRLLAAQVLWSGQAGPRKDGFDNYSDCHSCWPLVLPLFTFVYTTWPASCPPHDFLSAKEHPGSDSCATDEGRTTIAFQSLSYERPEFGSFRHFPSWRQQSPGCLDNAGRMSFVDSNGEKMTFRINSSLSRDNCLQKLSLMDGKVSECIDWYWMD